MKSALFELLFAILLYSAMTAQQHGADGGSVPSQRCILPAEYQAVQKEVELRMSKLREQRLSATVKYYDPMGNGGINSFGKTITNYVDLDNTAGIKDYNCGAITYDGHLGTDIEILNFYDMDEGIPIICAAPGIVTYTHDGEFDRQTAWINTAVGNAVIVHHTDGSDGWYWHMRKNSLRVKVGDSVKVGDTLGLVGSSGYSTGPHLHFEIEQSKTVDPFTGSCQPDSSRWVNQSAYVLTLPFQVMDHGLTTIPVTWSSVCEKPPVKFHFSPGSKIFSWFRLRNIAKGDIMKWEFYYGTTLYTSFSLSADNTYSSSWWYGYTSLPSGATYNGQWTVKVYRNGTQMLQDTFLFDGIANQLPTMKDTTIVVTGQTSKSGEFVAVDADGSIFWYRIVSLPKNGTLVQSGGRGRKFSYTPNASFVGKDTLVLYAVDDENANSANARYVFDVSATPQSVALSEPLVPRALNLFQNYPNPFNPSTTIEFTVPEDGRTTLRIYDVLGREVATLVDGEMKAGEIHRTSFGASNLPSGVYFCRLESHGSRLIKKLLLVK